MDYTTNNNLEKGLDISKINMDETEDEEMFITPAMAEAAMKAERDMKAH